MKIAHTGSAQEKNEWEEGQQVQRVKKKKQVRRELKERENNLISICSQNNANQYKKGTHTIKHISTSHLPPLSSLSISISLRHPLNDNSLLSWHLGQWVWSSGARGDKTSLYRSNTLSLSSHTTRQPKGARESRVRLEWETRQSGELEPCIKRKVPSSVLDDTTLACDPRQVASP